MIKMFLLFSHTLTDIQKRDAIDSLKIDEFVYLPLHLQKIISHVPPESNNITGHIKPLFNFLLENAKPEDFVLVQGEFGMIYKVVEFCKSIDLTPIYATTKRVSSEKIIDGKIVKKSEFQHIRYRRY